MDFEAFLRRLHALIGSDVSVTVWSPNVPILDEDGISARVARLVGMLSEAEQRAASIDLDDLYFVVGSGGFFVNQRLFRGAGETEGRIWVSLEGSALTIDFETT